MSDVDEDRNLARQTAVGIYVDIVRARIAKWRDATQEGDVPLEDRVTIGPGLLPELLTPMPQAEYDALPVPSAEGWREAWGCVREDMRRARR